MPVGHLKNKIKRILVASFYYLHKLSECLAGVIYRMESRASASSENQFVMAGSDLRSKDTSIMRTESVQLRPNFLVVNAIASRPRFVLLVCRVET